MAPGFNALGVWLGLLGAAVDKPFLPVDNEHGIVAELQAQISGILHRESLSAAEAAQLKGRLVFGNSQPVGRMGAVASNLLERESAVAGRDPP